MKKIIIACAVALISGAAMAQATMEPKGTNSQGSTLGKQSSQVTGNGDWVSGNGTQDGPYGAHDQTTTPGSRADAVHDAKAAAGENTRNKGGNN